MSPSPIYWNRVGRVEIQGRDGQMLPMFGGDTALDFKFSGEYAANVNPRFEVEILGLSAKSINEYTVWNPRDWQRDRRRISVYAGYESTSSVTPIFAGIVTFAIPTNPPEMWLKISGLTIPDWNRSSASPQQFTMPIIDVAKEICIKRMGCKNVVWGSTRISPDLKVRFKFGNDTGSSIMERFCTRARLEYFIDSDSVAYIYDNMSQTPLIGNNRPAELSVETGLIGIANVSLSGAVVKMRLNDDFRCQDWISLKSKIMPKANGNYIILKKKHVGHFRGEDWYTELTLLRYNT